MTVRLDELNLHDSQLRRIVMPREGDGHDTVELHLRYVESYERPGFREAVLRFLGVWRVWLDMPMGVVPGVDIRGGGTSFSDERIERERARWRPVRPWALHTVELYVGRLEVICEEVRLDEG